MAREDKLSIKLLFIPLGFIGCGLTFIYEYYFYPPKIEFYQRLFQSFNTQLDELVLNHLLKWNFNHFDKFYKKVFNFPGFYMHECNAHNYVLPISSLSNYGMLHPSPLKTKLRPRSSRSSPYWEMERTLTNIFLLRTSLSTTLTIEDVSCSKMYP